MSTNLFSRLTALLPPSPLLIARVIETHADDTSTVSLPINAGDTVLSPGLSQGRLLRVRGSQVPAGANCFIRDGLIESRAPDGDPTLVVIGRVAPTPPSTRQLARNGTIPNQTLRVGAPYTLRLASFWKDGFAPNTYSYSGALAPGLTFSGPAGLVSGTATTVGAFTLTPAATDATERRVQQNAVTFTVTESVTIVASARSPAVGTDFSVPAHQAGDLLVLMLKSGSGTAPGTPSGWTSRASRDLSIGSGWRVASRVDTSNSVNTIAGAWASVMIVVVVRGGRIGAVGSSGEALVPNGGSQALPNLTLETPGESLVLAGVMSNGGGSAFSSLPGVTVLQDNTAPSLGGGNHGVFASTAPETTFLGRSIVVDTVFGAFVSAWAIELASS